MKEDKLTYKFQYRTTNHRKSVYDAIFIFLDTVAGNPSPERDFCKNMSVINRFIDVEDIEAMGDVVVGSVCIQTQIIIFNMEI